MAALPVVAQDHTGTPALADEPAGRVGQVHVKYCLPLDLRVPLDRNHGKNE